MNKSYVYTGSISLAMVKDGKDGANASSYFIDTNYNEIVYLKGKNGTSYVPSFLRFKVFNNGVGIALSDESWQLSYYNSIKDEYVIIGSVADGSLEFLTRPLISQEGNIKDSYTVIFDYPIFLEYYSKEENKREDISAMLPKWLEGEELPLFKFVYMQDGGAVSAKYIQVKLGVSSDMARLNLNAADITASIQESSLKFSANGLQLHNGDFSITDFNYIKVEDVTEATFSNYEALYTIGNNHDYEKANTWTENTIYYIREEQKVLYADGNGNSTLKGNVYADNGVFRGDIFANNGTFNGEINATSGTIGGFLVGLDYPQAAVSEEQNLNGFYIKLIDSQPTYYQLIYDNNAYYVQVLYSDKYDSCNCILGYYEFIEDQYTSITYPELNKTYFAQIDLTNINTFYNEPRNRLRSSGGKIILDGQNGLIEAENIMLGSGAKIEDKIVFSSDGEQITSALYNPEEHEGKILQAGNVFLNNDGTLNLGTLELYGGTTGNLDGYLRSIYVDQNGQTSNGFWRINEDGTARFKTLTVDNVTIENSVLKIDTVQNVGSTMIFRPAWQILDVLESPTKKIVIEATEKQIPDDLIDSWIWNGSDYYQITGFEVNEEEQIILQLDREYEKRDNNGVVSLGKSPTELTYKKAEETSAIPGRNYFIKNEDDEYSPSQFIKDNSYYRVFKPETYIMSINGSTKDKNRYSEDGNYIDDFGVPLSLTVSSFFMDAERKLPAYTKHLILGQLSNSGIDLLKKATGFGLYADNVYLNGSLITKDSTNGYAGINTNNAVAFNKISSIVGTDLKEDTSPIIFWGGADSDADEHIKNAKFQVTAQGTLYTQQAIIENSSVSGSNIYGVQIYGASIHGWRDGKSTALDIYDTAQGINFKTEGENENNNIFSIESKGLRFDENNYFIKLDRGNKLATFNGAFYSNPDPNTSCKLEIIKDCLSFVDSENSKMGCLKGEIDASNDNTFGIHLYVPSSEESNLTGLSVYRDEIVSQQTFKAMKGMKFESTMEYKQIIKDSKTVGYDLYVYA